MDQVNKPFGDQHSLDQFFRTLQSFNRGNPIDKKIQNEIRHFMTTKWKYDKNNFILEN
jgi:hypothetical protein